MGINSRLICQVCDQPFKRGNQYCEKCGSRRPANDVVQQPQVAVQLDVASNESSSRADQVLRTWKPFRWLFCTEYGRLSISGDHLVYEIKVKYSHKSLQLLFMIMAFGFNWLALFQGRGLNQLKNVTVVETRRIQWLSWTGKFLLIRSANFFGIYPYAGEQSLEVEQFVRNLSQASAEAKYKTTGEEATLR